MEKTRIPLHSETSAQISRTMCSRKTTKRQVQNNVQLLNTSTVAFSTSMCREASGKSIRVESVSSLKCSTKAIALFYLVILFSSLNIVIATSRIEESAEYSDTSESVIETLPHRTKQLKPKDSQLPRLPR